MIAAWSVFGTLFSAVTVGLMFRWLLRWSWLTFLWYIAATLVAKIVLNWFGLPGGFVRRP